MKRSCSGCDFFEPAKGEQPAECRESIPQVVPMMAQSKLGVPVMQVQVLPRPVMPDYWCGKFQPRKEANHVDTH